MWELLGKNALVFIIVPPNFWCVSYSFTVTVSLLYHPYEFNLYICYGVGTVPNIYLDCHQRRIGNTFVSYVQEGTGNNCTKFRVNLSIRCRDMKYFNLKERHLLVISQNVLQSLRVLWWSSNLSFMSGLQHFANLQKKKKKKRLAEKGVVYITRFNAIQGMRGYKVFDCAIKYI